MKNNFQITGIADPKFNNLFNLEEKELRRIGCIKMIVDEKPGYPCRVSLEDADIGEEVILMPYKHHPVKSPYQSSGPIFIRKNAVQANLKVNEIPLVLHHRLLSLRVYDKDAMMIEAHTIEGKKLAGAINNIFENLNAVYIQIHNSSPGCYSCQVNRVE